MSKAKQKIAAKLSKGESQGHKGSKKSKNLFLVIPAQAGIQT